MPFWCGRCRRSRSRLCIVKRAWPSIVRVADRYNYRQSKYELGIAKEVADTPKGELFSSRTEDNSNDQQRQQQQQPNRRRNTPSRALPALYALLKTCTEHCAVFLMHHSASSPSSVASSSSAPGMVGRPVPSPPSGDQ